CQYVAVCNAAETFLVHQAIAQTFLPKLVQALSQYSVEIFGCEKTQAIISCSPATAESWKTEYLDYKVSIKEVADMHDALDHINKYGSGHTETILTKNSKKAELFMNL